MELRLAMEHEYADDHEWTAPARVGRRPVASMRPGRYVRESFNSVHFTIGQAMLQ